MALPSHVKYVIVGAGIHGLSTAWHLGENLRKSGKGSGKDILVIDKTAIAAGASGIACGVVRNNYFQPAMRRLMAHSVSVWESDPEAFSYHPVGYMQISPEVMHEDVATIHEQQRAIGYTSDLIEGEDACRAYLESIFSDWQAKNVTVVLHEKKGGYAESMPSMLGLRAKGEALGVRLVAPVTVAGFESDGGAVTRVVTDRGD
ncbi:MAG: NAD(P)/FAD-dependent oxidoreductase, partial [Gammaproteobacteria bacterium]